MQTLWRNFVLAFLMISAASSPALADEAAAKGGERPAGRAHQSHWTMGPEAPWISIMLRHRSELSLSSEQVATLEKLRSDFQQQVAPTQEDLRNTESEIARLLQEPTVDLARVRSKIEEAEKPRSEFRYLRIEALEKGKATLTAEQRDTLETLSLSSHGRFRKPQGENS